MKLIEQVKLLRKEFPELKIRQTTDALNRKCAVFELENCSENITLYFEHDYIVLEFYGIRTIYGYPETEFQYLLQELHSLIECRTLVLFVESGGVHCGGFVVSADSLNCTKINEAAKRLCREKFCGALPKSAYANLCYCNTELDSCEYCDFSK